MNVNQGFPAVAVHNSQILILGSMPGCISLQQHQYYAHPRNSFWKIMSCLFGFADHLNYPQRLALLQKHKIALWDVIYRCERPGSLDSNIKHQSIIPNDFNSFFKQHSSITHIFFNGSRAEQEYIKRIIPNLPEKFQSLPSSRLPSTSPAMASLDFKQKLKAWTQVKQALENNAP